MATWPINDIYLHTDEKESTGDVSNTYIPNMDGIENSVAGGPHKNDQKYIQYTPIEFSSDIDSVSYYEPDTYNINNIKTSNIIPNELQRSDRIQKLNPKYTSNEWANLVTSINGEKIPWSTYGDPSMFVPEPKGIKAVLSLKHTNPPAYKLWSCTIRAEIKNQITIGTFKQEDTKKEDFSIPRTLVFKVKLTADGEWDKAKARICVHGDIHRKLQPNIHYILSLQMQQKITP